MNAQTRRNTNDFCLLKITSNWKEYDLSKVSHINTDKDYSIFKSIQYSKRLTKFLQSKIQFFKLLAT